MKKSRLGARSNRVSLHHIASRLQDDTQSNRTTFAAITHQRRHSSSQCAALNSFYSNMNINNHRPETTPWLAMNSFEPNQFHEPDRPIINSRCHPTANARKIISHSNCYCSKSRHSNLLIFMLLHLLVPIALVVTLQTPQAPTTTPATNPSDLSSSGNEISKQAANIAKQPSFLANFVKLGNTTSSRSHPSSLNLIQPKTAATIMINQTFNSDINNSQQTVSQRSRVPEVICIGTSNRFSVQLNKTDHYHNMYERYRNCTHVVGNLEVTWLDDERLDLSFLESIREIDGYLLIGFVKKLERIRLPNLHIIRGRETFKMNNDKRDEFSMLIMENDIKYLELPNLREIISGNVGFHTNKNLCFYDKIDWSEILNAPFGTKFVTDKTNSPSECQDVECHASCLGGPCWSNAKGMCQQFSKNVCSPQCDKGRCFGSRPRDCCHMMCAGGCIGPKQTDCFACKNFNNDGECVQECPQMYKYSSSKFIWEPNPDGRHSYGSSCVKECPEHLLRDNGACVRSCPPDKRSKNGECVPCAGPCPKNCLGVDVVNSKNIENFVNCTEIEGSITILDTSFNGYAEAGPNHSMGVRYEPMHPSKLMVFQTVRNITGSVNIQGSHPDFRDLSFLSKLENIDGRQLTDMLLSLSIVKTSLRSLNLRSLKRIKNGKVLIDENKDLCYADLAQFIKNNITRRDEITIKNNGDAKKCRALGLTCHEQCEGGPGECWGPGQDECSACKHYKLESYCVRDCASTQALDIYSYAAGHKTCQRCHSECQAGCFGSHANECRQCKHFKDGPFCVPECPEHKYNDNNICQECNKRCVNGCTGPLNRLGQGGCNTCDKFVIESIANASVVASCLKADEPCPMGFYQEYGAEVDDDHHMKPFERKPVCKRCHQKCKSCSGYGTHKDVCECAGYMANDQCEDRCPREFYADSASRRCLKCSIECNGCYGPTEADCLNCRVYRIYYDSLGPVAAARVFDASQQQSNLANPNQAVAGGGKQKSRFNCTSQCPAEKPYRVSEGNLFEPYCSQDPGPDSDNPRIVSLGGTTFFFVLIISGAIMFCVSIYRCQIEREKTAKLAMALSLGITDAEPLKQSHVPPNLAELRSITTSELKQGPMLGHGVGGTVYQAVWCPEGTKDKRPVAMKILRDNGQQNMNKEFLDEAYIMASVNHQNLVKLLGVCITPKELILVTPLMPLGCLRDYVEKNKHEIGPKNLLEWGKQIANGMAYLEEHRMVHRDLALRNVLLQNFTRAVISDFGLAKFLEVDQDEYHSGGGRLPIKWLAPECIRERKFTHKSDVWAFGVTIWELLTFGEKPFEEYDPKDVPMAIENAARLRQPKFVTTEVYRVMLACWFYSPEDRPNFKSLHQDFVNFARDPERYLGWRPNGECQSFDCRCSDNENDQDYDSDEEESSLDDNRTSREINNNQSNNNNISPPHSAGVDVIGQHQRMNGLMMGFEMRQHNSESDARFGHVSTTPIVKKMSMAEDVFSRSSQQMSSMSTSTTIMDSNNNNNNNLIGSNNLMSNANYPTGHLGPVGNANTSRLPEGSWWSVRSHQHSINSLGQRSEQPTDSDDYLVPSPRSNEEKYAQFYDQRNSALRLPPRPGPPSSRDPPHSAGLIGISNDAYFIGLGMRNYGNTNGATNASSGNIPSSLV